MKLSDDRNVLPKKENGVDEIINQFLDWCKTYYWEDLVSKFQEINKSDGKESVHHYWEVINNNANQLQYIYLNI